MRKKKQADIDEYKRWTYDEAFKADMIHLIKTMMNFPNYGAKL